MCEPTFLILAIFAPPLPNTLPTTLAGINISRVDGGGKLCTIKEQKYNFNQFNIKLGKVKSEIKCMID